MSKPFRSPEYESATEHNAELPRDHVGRLPAPARRIASSITFLARRLSSGALNLARRSAKGIFPPIGLLSTFALALLTANLSAWGVNQRYWPYYLFLACGLIAGFFLWRTSRRRYIAIFSSTFGWLPVFLGAVSYLYWYWYAHGNTPGEEFFHTAAEVLPVLLLAAILDVRRTRYLESKQLVLPIAAVFLGEIAALNVLAFGYAGPSDFAAVSSSLVVAIVALILAVLADVGPVAEDEPAIERAPNLRTGSEDHQPLSATGTLVVPERGQLDEPNTDADEASVDSS